MKKERKCTKCEIKLDNKTKKKGNRNSWCDGCYKEYGKQYREKNLKSEYIKEKEKLAEQNLKKCTKCDTIKNFEEFHKSKAGFRGLRAECNICVGIYDKNFQERTNCRNKRDKKEEAHQYRKKYRLDNLDEWRKYEREYRKRKRDENPFYKIKMNLSSRISDIIRGRISRIRTIELLGCSREEFTKHIESQFTEGMNWDNYGKTGWQVDHIKPVSKFNLLVDIEMRECWNYKNLQPLWWYDNLTKGNKYE